MNELLKKAIEYSKRNWMVFPCRECPSDVFLDKNGKEKQLREKTPYTKNGFKDASLEESVITAWWEKYPHALIGIACGPSNLFVLDIDTKHGKNGIDTFMGLGIDDSGALHSITPSGGLHIVFSGVGKTTTSCLTGLDTRGEGGYFIVPPSKVLAGETTGSYIEADNWNRKPISVSEELMQKLNVTKEKKIKEKKTFTSILSKSEKIVRSQEALEKLPQYMCDNYSDWIRVGMTLRSLGDDGLILWRNWSEKSPKYKDGECEDKWDTFDPREITIGTLFYLAQGNP
jgi:hypothetical protein